ncbi:hypothetical protein ALC62_01950 [Cyphomyrmex costatus]|uniref:Gustatory receptor n=1 Tax=Cyphomyrmex costatus TaxID=456900 RepID=A0A151IP10_9HYME|nr:hypothetical protein ALC62_01950 [Cyphomyrmex costatus]
MTKTLQSSMKLLFIISSFHCLGLFEYPLGQPRMYFSCLYTLAVWGTLIYYYYYPKYSLLWQYNLLSFVNIILGIYTLIAVLSIFISFYRYKELKICLRELSIVDDTLEALGVPKEYQILRNWIIRIIIGWIAIIFNNIVQTIYSAVVLFGSKISFKIVFHILLACYIKNVVILSALICGTVLGYTSSRFHRINDLLLHVLYSDLSENNADYRCRRQNRSILVRQRITEDKDRKQYIWILT